VGSLGHPSDDETGLIYMQARHYEPVCGRFVSEDPSCNGSNWLTYCEDNPVNKVDRTGEYCIYGAGAAIAWFLYLTHCFIKSENVTDKVNDLKYAWGLVLSVLIYDLGAPTAVSNGLAQGAREIAKWADSACNIP
jgi:RHS repeat-associated protein